MLPAYPHRCIFDVWEFQFNGLTLKLRRHFLASNKIRPDVRDKKGRGNNICYKTRHLFDITTLIDTINMNNSS